jgi:hypothetical protein
LVDALEHITYEIWKFRQSVALYEALQRVGGDAAIEVRVLHHRVLLEFLYGPPKHEDNIVAWEYVPDWQQTHARVNVPWLDNYMRRCHTMLAHISTTRSEVMRLGLKSWGDEWQTVEPHLHHIIGEFLTAMSAGHRTVCLGWINGFVACNQPGGDTLMGMAQLLQ